MKNRKTVILMIMVLVIAAFASGCGGKVVDDPTGTVGTETVNYTLNYINAEYYIDADESLERFLESPASVTVTEPAMKAEIRLNALNELKNVPDSNAGEQIWTFVQEDWVFNKVTVNGTKCVVDLSGKNAYDLGEAEEDAFLGQIVRTVLSLNDGVKEASFTIDGKAAGFLFEGGVTDLSAVFTAEDFPM